MEGRIREHRNDLSHENLFYGSYCNTKFVLSNNMKWTDSCAQP